ncbi:MAG: hypothetical protein RMN51_07300 [Verrucomicrobiota bacterium]|nr:hypothetical protein [Limisphaera sp.]MDW8381896.1 hypothetical protein [Verrucomicrobiota bacterium]
MEVHARGASAWVRIGWKRAGQWNWSLTQPRIRFTEHDRSGWRRACDIIQVPQDADELVLLLEVRQMPDEITWFDDIGVYTVPPWEALPNIE